MLNNFEQCCGIVKNTDKLCSIKCNNGYYYCKYHYKQKDEKENFTKSITNYLQLVKNENAKEQKILVSKRMFDFCIYNKYLINTMPSFKNTILKKLNELAKSDKLFEYYLDEKLWENNNIQPQQLHKQQQKKVFIKLENPIVITTNDAITI
jgi:hypothetical protein